MQNVNVNYGLSKNQIDERIKSGNYNKDVNIKTKSCKQIILENTFTFFNAMHLCLAGIIVIVGIITNIPFIDIVKNMLFLGVIFSNIAIGSIQGIRSKKTIDKLSLISTPKTTVIRDGSKQIIPVNQIVLDDIILLGSGNQVCSDCVIKEGEVEVNESLITGEFDPITKKQGEKLLSGSFIVSGSCICQVEHVALENYAQKIVSGAKYIKKHQSNIMKNLNKIVKIVSFAIVPVGLLLFCKQYFLSGVSLQNSVFATTAALIGMIPEGLMLLTGVVFALGVIRLSKHKTLVQEMYSIETLARVNVLCLDKTGTITEGKMVVDKIIPLNSHNKDEVMGILNDLAANLKDENPTFSAIKNICTQQSQNKAVALTPFSSQRKWSGVNFENCSYVLGATEFVFPQSYEKLLKDFNANGERILIVAKSNNFIKDKCLPQNLVPVGFVLIKDKIRKEAAKTLQFFKEQGVNIKIISGDNVETVVNIAKTVGVLNADKYVDARDLKTESDIEKAVAEKTVFARVTPEQKLQFVKALKKQGNTVAMTGDGVNDVLALKEADCSIAMACGSDAVKNVSNLVLLDSNFASIPKVVAEGRRSINNLQRSGALFLSKTTYSVLMALFFIFVSVSYPFLPIQLTLVSTLAIGIPSFILALEQNTQMVKGQFITNVISKSIPTGFSVFLGVIIVLLCANIFALSNYQIFTLCLINTIFCSLSLLFSLCKPFNILRVTLFTGVFVSFVVSYIFFKSFFNLASLNLNMWLISILVGTVCVIVKHVIQKIIKIKIKI